MRLGRNLLAGMASSVWSAAVGLAVVPWYLKYLGIEAYGLIGFFAMTQAMLALLDCGLAPTMNREVARCSAAENMREAGNLLHTLAVVYWGTAGFIALLLPVLAPFIAQYWLQAKSLPRETVSHAMMLMGFVAACRWPIALYQAALIGAQRVTVSSAVNISMTALGSLGAVCVLAFISPTIEAFFIWQAFVGLIYAFTMRWAAWRIIGRVAVKFMPAELQRIWRFSAGVGGTAVAGMILMQMDKILLSRMLSLADFGRYSLAAVVATGLLVLLAPSFNIIYPELSALVVGADSRKLLDFYRSGTRLLASILFPITMAAVVCSRDLFFLWTGDPGLASSVMPIVSLLLIGTALNGVMIFPYALQLAFGMTRLPLTIASSLLFIHIPLTYFLAKSYGAVGGASAWPILNILYIILGTWMTHRHMLKGIAVRWITRDVALPLAISLLVIGAGWAVLHVNGSYFTNVLLSSGLALLVIPVNVKILLGDKLDLFLKRRNFQGAAGK